MIIEKFGNVILVESHINYNLNNNQKKKGHQFERFIRGQNVSDDSVINNRDEFQNLKLAQIHTGSISYNILISSEIDALTYANDGKVNVTEIKLSNMEMMVQKGIHWQMISNGSGNVLVGETSPIYPNPLINLHS